MLGCELRKQVGEKAAGKTAGLDLVDHLKELREEMAEMSLRVEKLERAVLWEGSGCSSGSSGNEWGLVERCLVDQDKIEDEFGEQTEGFEGGKTGDEQI